MSTPVFLATLRRLPQNIPMYYTMIWFLLVTGPMWLALALGALCVWAWTVRKKHPRTSRTICGLLAIYLLLGALGWGLFLTSEIPVRHPEWFGWTEPSSAAEDAP